MAISCSKSDARETTEAKEPTQITGDRRKEPKPEPEPEGPKPEVSPNAAEEQIPGGALAPPGPGNDQTATGFGCDAVAGPLPGEGSILDPEPEPEPAAKKKQASGVEGGGSGRAGRQMANQLVSLTADRSAIRPGEPTPETDPNAVNERIPGGAPAGPGGHEAPGRPAELEGGINCQSPVASRRQLIRSLGGRRVRILAFLLWMLVTISGLGMVGHASEFNCFTARNTLMEMYYATNGPNWPAEYSTSWGDYNTPVCRWTGLNDRGFFRGQLDPFCGSAVAWLFPRRRRVPGGNRQVDLQCASDCDGCSWWKTGECGHTCDGTAKAEMDAICAVAGSAYDAPCRITSLRGYQQPSPILTLKYPNPALSGTLPSSIESLFGLEALQLPQMALSGTLPATIGGLTRLYDLDLSQAAFSGTLPASISSLTWLGSLKLSSNVLSGTLSNSISSLTTLLNLDLSSNALSGTLSNSISSLTRLNRLHLSSNALSGTLLNSITSLTRLGQLQLSNNVLSGTISNSITSLTTLVNLVLSSNAFSGTLLNSITSLTILFQLDLSSNVLSGTLSNSLPRVTADRWRQLDLSGNALSGTVPRGISSLAGLLALGLSNSSISGTIPGGMASLLYLKSLQLSNSSISGTVPGFVGSLTRLEALGLGQTRLSGSIPSALGDLTALEGLFLQSASLSGSIPAALGRLTELQGLVLYQNRLDSTIPSELGNLSKLEYLALHNNRLAGSSSASFENWAKLELLSLFGNSELDWDLSLLMRYERATALLLKDCSIRGTMPPGLTRNTVLKTLILENNQISGTIPVGISDTMPALESLLVANNLISGTLPPGLWRLSKLTTLLAHGMRLSGTIPTRASYYGTKWQLTELSLARNYVRGRTDVFETAENLKTLLLSGNYLSGDAARMDGAAKLANGTFEDPGQQAINALAKTAKVEIKITLTNYDGVPLTVLISVSALEVEAAKEFPSTVLVFTGNSITSTGSGIPPSPAGQLCQVDKVQQVDLLPMLCGL